MITKQQALEFIHELSNSFSISMDLTKGIDCYLNVYSDSCGTFGVEGDFNSLEEVMLEFIKRFGNTALLEDLECLIPVDIDMLEVGQTYKIKYDSYGDIKEITDKLEKIILDKSRRSKYLYFKRESEIYKAKLDDKISQIKQSTRAR